MRVIIAGSRDIASYDTVLDIVTDSGFPISTIISGGARGVDTIAKQLAIDFGIPFIEYPADWDRYGRRYAGTIRNRQMAENADALIAVWDGISPGTANMINIARRLNLRVHTGLANAG